MNIARILYPVKVLGPGRRIGIWVAGCNRRCPGCSNPELWEQRPEYEISVAAAARLIRTVAARGPVDGFTISGGEPMNQASDLAELLTSLQDISDDILLYTGYRLDELKAGNNLPRQGLLSQVSVLIDGEYVESLNCDVPIRGSSNQSVHYFKAEHMVKYMDYFEGVTNQIQNFTTIDGIVSVGIHKPQFGRK